MICFSADFYGAASWGGDDFPLQKELNQLAADRGIKLMIGGLGIGCEGTGLLNKESYPNGEDYLCLTTKTMGNCRSNDELTKQIQDRRYQALWRLGSRSRRLLVGQHQGLPGAKKPLTRTPPYLASHWSVMA